MSCVSYGIFRTIIVHVIIFFPIESRAEAVESIESTIRECPFTRVLKRTCKGAFPWILILDQDHRFPKPGSNKMLKWKKIADLIGSGASIDNFIIPIL